MQSIGDLCRRVVAVLRQADALGNLEKHLSMHIPPVVLDKVQIRNLLNPKVLGWGDPEDLRNHILDEFIDRDVGGQLAGKLKTMVKNWEGMGKPEDVKGFMDYGDVPAGVDKKKFVDEAVKFVASFLDGVFKNLIDEYRRKHEKEESEETLMEKGKEVGVMDEQVEKQIRQQYDWEEGLIRDIIDLINREVAENKRGLYKVILRDRFLIKDKKSFQEIEAATGVPYQTIEKDEKRLAGILGQFLKAQGLGPKFDLSEKQVEVPSDSEDILKGNEENQKDLKEYLRTLFRAKKPGGTPVSDTTLKILDNLVEGKSVGEIADELGMNRQIVQNTKHRYFTPGYESWYKEKVEEMRAVCARVISAAPKTVRIPVAPGGEPSESKGGGPKKMHESMVKGLIAKNLFDVLITFSSNFDVPHKTEGDAEFKWKKYTVTAMAERKGLSPKGGEQKVYTVDYQYEADIGVKGKVEGDGKNSALKIDGNLESGELKDDLDKYVKDMVGKGIVPMHGVHASFVYQNIKDGKKYYGVASFRKMFEGIYEGGEVEEEAEKEKKEFLRKKRLGPGKAMKPMEKVHEYIADIEHALKTEKDPEIRKQLEGWLKEYLKYRKDPEGVDFDEVLDKTKGWVEQQSAFDLKELEEIKKQEKMRRHPTVVHSSLRYAVGLGPMSGKAKDFFGVLADYGVDKAQAPAPNPSLWMLPKDFAALGKILRSKVETRYEKDLERPKGMKKEDYAQTVDSAKERKNHALKVSADTVEDFIKDMGVRRDDLKKGHPADYTAMVTKYKDVDWVDDKGQVGTVVGRWVANMKQDVAEKEPPKQKSMLMLERKKFQGLMGHLNVNREGFATLADALNEASMIPLGSEKAQKEYADLKKKRDEMAGEAEELQKKIEKLREEGGAEKGTIKTELSNVMEESEALKKKLDEVDKDLRYKYEVPEDEAGKKKKEELETFQKDFKGAYESNLKYIMNLSVDPEVSQKSKTSLKDLYKEVGGLKREIQNIDQAIAHKEVIPAMTSAKILNSYREYFSELYHFFSKLPWFRDSFPEEVLAAEGDEEPKKTVDEMKGDLDKLKGKIVGMARHLAGMSLFSDTEVNSQLSKMGSDLKKLINGLGDLQYEFKTMTKSAVDYDEIRVLGEEGDREKALQREYIPSDLMHEAQGLIHELGASKNTKIKAMGAVAQKELDKAVGNAVEAIKEFHKWAPKNIDKIVKEKKVTREQAGRSIQQNEEAFIKGLFDSFIGAWSEVSPTKKREKSPLGNRPAHEYEAMEEYVAHHLPKLTELGSGEEEIEVPKDIPSSEKMQKLLETTWIEQEEAIKNPEKLRKLYKDSVDFGGGSSAAGGGGGGSGRTRPKALKAPIPHGTWEELKDWVVKLMKGDPSDFAIDLLGMVTLRLRKAIDKAYDEDKYIAMSDVVDGLVSVLKNAQNTIVALDVGPSVKQFTQPPPGAPKWSGTPEIPIDSYAEAVKLFNNIVDIYDEINHYIAPDTVGVPPKNLSQMSRPGSRKYLPPGLVDWAQWLAEKEGKGPKKPEKEASDVIDFPCELSHAVAMRFASEMGLGERTETEFEAVTQ